MHRYMIPLIILFAGNTLARISDHITFTDSSYSYEISVHSVKSTPVLFAFLATDSVTFLLRGNASSITIDTIKTLIRQVTTVFRAFGYQATTHVIKEVIPEQMLITMNVVSFVHNWDLLPEVKYGRGIFQVSPGDSDRSVLRYQQDVTLDRKINPLTRLLIRWQLAPLGRDIKNTVTEFSK